MPLPSLTESEWKSLLSSYDPNELSKLIQRMGLTDRRWLYRANPTRFAKEILQASPTPYQAQTMQALVEHRRVAVRGPHGIGKTAEAAWLVLWACAMFDDCKIPTTASAWRQLTHFLWPEIRKWAMHAQWHKLGIAAPEILQHQLKRGPTCEAFAIASDKGEHIEGAHAAHLLYVFDEAKAIPEDIWQSAEGAFAGGDAYAFAISTPGASSGMFYGIHARWPGLEKWWTRHVTLEEGIAAGRVSAEWAADRKMQWGETSSIYRARVLGEFTADEPDALIQLSWLDTARQHELPAEGELTAGLDVARSGDDDTVLTIRRGKQILACHIWHGHDTMATTGRVKQHGVPCGVDVIGIGAGVYDRLNEQGFPCWPVNVAEAAEDSERFTNLRVELAWRLRTMLENGELDLTGLSQDAYDRLCGEATGIKLDRPSSDGRMRLEPKELTKKRLGRSPDVWDSLTMSFASQRVAVGDFVEG